MAVRAKSRMLEVRGRVLEEKEEFVESEIEEVGEDRVLGDDEGRDEGEGEGGDTSSEEEALSEGAA